MICKSCGSEFSEQLPLCPYCAAPRGESAEKGGVDKILTAAGESLNEFTAKAKIQAEAAGESLNELAAKAKVQAEAAGENLNEFTAKAKVKTKAASASFYKYARKILCKAYVTVKRFLLYIAEKIKLFAEFAAREFEENCDAPNFWADLGVVVFLVLIILILIVTR